MSKKILVILLVLTSGNIHALPKSLDIVATVSGNLPVGPAADFPYNDSVYYDAEYMRATGKQRFSGGGSLATNFQVLYTMASDVQVGALVGISSTSPANWVSSILDQDIESTFMIGRVGLGVTLPCLRLGDSQLRFSFFPEWLLPGTLDLRLGSQSDRNPNPDRSMSYKVGAGFQSGLFLEQPVGTWVSTTIGLTFEYIVLSRSKESWYGINYEYADDYSINERLAPANPVRKLSTWDNFSTVGLSVGLVFKP